MEKVFGLEAKKMVETWLPPGSTQTLITQKDKSGKFGRILGKFRIFDGKNDRESTINEWMIENHYAVAYNGQSKKAVANEHLKNYQEIVEGVDITQDELDMYISSRS